VHSTAHVPLDRRRHSGRGEKTRQRILDAAEALFADRGFHGTSIRDITLLAGVENALASYHFKTKEQLFTEVLRRRAVEHRADLIESLEAAERQARPGLPTNQALVKAYARPALEKIGRGAGWAAYTKLMVSIQNLDRNDAISLMTNDIFDGTIRRYVAAFENANPTAPKRRIHFALYFLHGTLIHVLSQGRTFERLVESEPGFQDPDEILEELACQFATGLNRD